MDKVSVYNLALSAVGISDRISKADEDSLERLVCQDWLPVAMDDVLRRYPWRFFLTAAKLNPTKTDLPPYRYSAVLPDDCLTVHQVYGAVGAESNDINLLTQWQVHGQNRLMTVSAPFSCAYVRKPNEAELETMPLQLIELIAMRLAVCIATPMTRSNDLTAKLMQLFNVRLGEAMMAEAANVREVAYAGGER